ncbi:MAG TPA: arsenate reductase ArsC [Fimbriimonas sp.]
MRILFVCVHNAGRSQMAEAFLRKLASERNLDVESASAGTLGGGSIHPAVADAMREAGVPLDGQRPKALTQQMVDRSDLVVSMGCGVDSKACPANFIVAEDWGIDDPAGQPIERVRQIRDRIRAKVEAMLDLLGSRDAGAAGNEQGDREG